MIISNLVTKHIEMFFLLIKANKPVIQTLKKQEMA